MSDSEEEYEYEYTDDEDDQGGADDMSMDASQEGSDGDNQGMSESRAMAAPAKSYNMDNPNAPPMGGKFEFEGEFINCFLGFIVIFIEEKYLIFIPVGIFVAPIDGNGRWWKWNSYDASR